MGQNLCWPMLFRSNSQRHNKPQHCIQTEKIHSCSWWIQKDWRIFYQTNGPRI